MKQRVINSCITAALLVLMLTSCKSEPEDPPEPVMPVPGAGVTDADGNVYATVIIGEQEWLAENLRYQTENSWCYDDDPENCLEYGRLYTWYTLYSACPSGWHLPTNADWSRLEENLGTDAGGMLKTTGTIEDGTGVWSNPNVGATNASLFSAVPGGMRATDGTCSGMGAIGIWWSASGNDSGLAWTRTLDAASAEVARDLKEKRLGLSIRCLRD